ncbi:MAG: sugar phosphate nucleotidyltransferase [Hyphomonadaceae bacterium]
MTTTIVPVLMVGGSGTRLWPVSRRDTPKQFQALTSDKSLFQETVLRVTGDEEDVRFTSPVLIGAGRYEAQIRDQLAAIQVTPQAIILEPSAQNTAAVAAVAARYVAQLDENALVLLLPSDAYISDISAFRDAIAKAANVAADDWITTFGIAPERPETGFGYIQQGNALTQGCYQVEAFKEKPDLATAQTYISNPDYSWNSGIFLFSPNTMISEMQTHANDVLATATEALAQADVEGDLIGLNAGIFSTVRKVSIDYAVMEHTRKAAVYGGLHCGWSDVGGWQALAEMASTKHSGATPQTIHFDSETSYFRNDGSLLLTAVGLEDMIVVAHEGSVLILPKSRAQDVKSIINELEARGASDKL